MIDDDMLQKRVAVEPEVARREELVETLPQRVTIFHVFMFPLNRPGLTVLGFYAVAPFLLGLLVLLITALLPLFGIALRFVALIINVLISLSTLWYLAVCIRASAEGQTQAPEVFEFGQDDSFWDWLRQFFLILTTVCLCVGPAFVYRYFAHTNGAFFWVILGVGIFFLPMCLLAMVIFDTINALNPVLIIASIFSTFFSYLGVVLLFCMPILLIGGMLRFSGTPLLAVPIKAVGLYLLMMDAYLLGRFFYRNEENLRWDV